MGDIDWMKCGGWFWVIAGGLFAGITLIGYLAFKEHQAIRYDCDNKGGMLVRTDHQAWACVKLEKL